jgi:hypothetical protein
MAFTDNSDFYAAVHDEGINTVVKRVMRQRPSLFNYGTPIVQANPNLLCEPIDAAPAVTQLITVMEPIPLLGADFLELDFLSSSGTNNLALDFAVQLTDLEIDFHPENVFTQPSELNPPLEAQRVAFRARICAGLSCIPKEILQSIPIGRARLGNPRIARPSGRVRSSRVGLADEAMRIFSQNAAHFAEPVIAAPPIVILPSNKLECFCIELFGVGYAAFTGQAGNQRLLIEIDGLELVNIEPKGIENSIECYIYLLLDRVILPQLSDAISEIAFRLHEFPPLPDDPSSLNSIQLSASTTAPKNPAVEEDQLKLFTNLEELELNIPPITIGGGDEPPTPSRTERSRSRTGPNHLTAAVSESTFRRVFAVVRDTRRFKITIAPQSVTILGVTGTAGAEIEFHLDGGTVGFRDDNTVRIDELDIKWDKLEVTLGLDLPSVCFSLCVPFTDYCTELGCLFEGEPDFSFTIALPTIFTTEISLNAGPKVYYGIGSPNEWMVHLDPSRVDVDIIDIADTAGDLLDGVLDAIIEAMGLPDWADFLADSMVDLVRALLDIPDDVGEWLQDLIFDTLGIESTISSYISDWLADGMPIFRLEDPVQVMDAEGDLIPVTIPIQFIGARVNADEMIIETDLGG